MAGVTLEWLVCWNQWAWLWKGKHGARMPQKPESAPERSLHTSGAQMKAEKENNETKEAGASENHLILRSLALMFQLFHPPQMDGLLIGDTPFLIPQVEVPVP